MYYKLSNLVILESVLGLGLIFVSEFVLEAEAEVFRRGLFTTCLHIGHVLFVFNHGNSPSHVFVVGLVDDDPLWK